MRRLRVVTILIVLFAALPAAADYYYAVAVGEKRFLGREDRAYRATRSAMHRCAAEFDPMLCEEVSLERIDRRWESEVIGKRGFYSADSDRHSRAERRALDACRSAQGLGNCTLQEITRLEPEEDPREREPGVEDLLRDLLED